ncbi:MAG: NAD-dependent epimerase/dehydratase family protein [Steroidobacteraceae bacterium]
MKRVLIVGGADFIGGRLAARLSQSASLRPALADKAFNASAAASGVERLSWDLADVEALFKLLDKVDVIVNCVAGDANTMRRAAQALFAAAARAGLPVLQLSTLAAYGSAEGVINEASPLLGDVDDYAAARAEIDRMAEAYGATRLRPGIIYGPGSIRWTTQVGNLLLAKRLGDLGAAGDGCCNLILIDDLVEIMVQVLETPGIASGAVNLCNSERVTWNEFFIRYAKALGAVPVRRITGRGLRIETKLLAPPIKIVEMLLGAQRAQQWRLPALLSPSLLRVCSQEIHLDNSKAEGLFGRQWTPLDIGLRRAADWYLKTR